MVLKTRHQKLQPAQRLRIYRRGKGKQHFGELRAIFEKKKKIKACVNAPIALPSFFYFEDSRRVQRPSWIWATHSWMNVEWRARKINLVVQAEKKKTAGGGQRQENFLVSFWSEGCCCCCCCFGCCCVVESRGRPNNVTRMARSC